MKISNKSVLMNTQQPENVIENQLEISEKKASRSWWPLVILCGISIGGSFLFGAANWLFCKVNGWVFKYSTDGFIHLLQTMMIVIMVGIVGMLLIVNLYYGYQRLIKAQLPLLMLFIGSMLSVIPLIGLLGSLMVGISGIWLTCVTAHLPWTDF